ncbi:MAG TPA: efflux RND transporter permease subunit [Saprospiraceae bacterium]|nr:efflux RND transporter permease subunit [Saprospiraceae bacterium]
MNIPKFAISNYQFTLTAFIFLLAMGLSAFFTMPQREDPALNIANMVVVAVYPGANPQDVESQVTDPIEEAVNELDDIKEVKTTIRDGVSITEVEFEFGVDPDDAFDDVQGKISEIEGELPADLYDLSVRKFSTNTVAIFQVALISESLPYAALKYQADELKEQLETVSGVRKVDIMAYPESEVRVALDPMLMHQMNITPDAVAQAIQSNNANIPGGAVKVSSRSFNIKTSGAYGDLEEIRNTVVGSYQGRLIYLKNVADVFFDYEDDRWVARHNGQRCLYITIQQKEGYNIFSISEPVKSFLAEAKLPEGMDIAYVFDQSTGVEERVDGFLNNLLQGILLVGLIIFLVLGYRSASIVMMAIPLSILIGLWVVNQMGFALQQISIAGLIVALGLLVDNSIAIIENIERYLASGYSRKEAAIAGTQQLIAPITSATLTTILAFIPIVMMPDVTGAFIKALPITVIATLIASLLGAISLTPLLSSWILKERKGERSRQTSSFRLMRTFVEGPYRRLLKAAMRYKWVSLGIAVAALVGALALFPMVGLSFFPKAEKPQLRITVTLPNGSNLDATDQAIRHVEAILDTTSQVSYYTANIGHGNPRIYYNVPSENYSNSYGEVFVVLKEYEVDEFYSLLDHFRAVFSGYPFARIDVKEFVQGPPSEAPVEVAITGDDLDRLREYATQVEEAVLAAPGAVNVNNPLSTNSTDLYFRINRDKAMLFGVPIYQVDQTIRTYVSGRVIGKFRDKEAEDYNIVLRHKHTGDFQLEYFDEIMVPSASGNYVPLRQLARIEFAEAPSRITHLDGKRTATVLADLEQGVTLDEAIADVDDRLAQLDWAEGYSYTFRGDLENRSESFGGLGTATLMAILLILGVLIIQFKSFTQPLIIFSALPLAVIGSILALLFTGINFSFTAFVGLTSLIGIAINNSIVLVDFANKLMEEGESVISAAQQAGEVRFVPIVLTTLTTILGLLPLTLAGGSLWAPMGWTIIGGLITSTTFVLLIVPILYVLFTRASRG